VLEHGTGALNIDGTRIDGEVKDFENDSGDAETCYADGLHGSTQNGTREGRYPSNVVFDETEAERLDESVGTLTSGSREAGAYETADGDVYGDFDEATHGALRGSSGGPSRYFYTSKASKTERTNDGSITNTHPTVKPIDLMEWLITLVTAEGQIVLDPFVGSGTTAVAAKNLNRRFVAVERQAEYVSLAQARAGLTPDDPSVVRSDDAQSGLEAYSQE
jgi:site-specific DNA-methyltransferase (adenine-specific)